MLPLDFRIEEGADPRRPGFVRGTSERYTPVAFRGHAPALLRRRVPVRAVGVDGDTVLIRVDWLLE